MAMAAKKGSSISGHDACGGTSVMTCSSNVFTEGGGLARVGDLGIPHGCKDHPAHPPIIANGSSSIIVNGKIVAKSGSACSCGCSVVSGCSTIMVP